MCGMYFTRIPRRPLQNHNLKLPHFRIRLRAKLRNIFTFALLECKCIVIVSDF